MANIYRLVNAWPAIRPVKPASMEPLASNANLPITSQQLNPALKLAQMDIPVILRVDPVPNALNLAAPAMEQSLPLA